MKPIKAFLHSGGTQDVKFDKEPHLCPHCHRSIAPQTFQAFRKGRLLEIVFRCPDDNCRMTFLGYYEEQSPFNSHFFYQKNSVGTVKGRTFTEEIQSVSASFIAIYNQALVAEGYQLDQIAGIGLRKALEFLIKDYVCLQKPEKSEDIRKKFLGACINDDVNNPNIKEMATRAVWLGNDETHYVRKWDDKDIIDLKILINITLHWIEMEMLTEKYKQSMEGGR